MSKIVSDEDVVASLVMKYAKIGLRKAIQFANEISFKTTKEQLFDLLQQTYIPMLESYLIKQHKQVFVKKERLNKLLPFYNNIKLEEEDWRKCTDPKATYPKLLHKLAKVKWFLSTVGFKQQLVQLIQTAIKHIILLQIALHNEVKDTVVAGGLYHINDDPLFNEFDEIFATLAQRPLHLDNNLFTQQFHRLAASQPLPAAKLPAQQGTNMRRLVIEGADIRQAVRLNEIYLIHKQYKAFTDELKQNVGFAKLLQRLIVPSPQDLFSEQYIINIIDTYLKYDYNCLISNIVCSDEFIQIVYKLWNIFV